MFDLISVAKNSKIASRELNLLSEESRALTLIKTAYRLKLMAEQNIITVFIKKWSA